MVINDPDGCASLKHIVSSQVELLLNSGQRDASYGWNIRVGQIGNEVLLLKGGVLARNYLYPSHRRFDQEKGGRKGTSCLKVTLCNINTFPQ